MRVWEISWGVRCSGVGGCRSMGNDAVVESGVCEDDVVLNVDQGEC